MGDFEEMLGSILSSPQDMEKIMGLARELSGGEKASTPEPERKPAPEAAPSIPGLGDLNPKLLASLGQILGGLNAPGDNKAALIASMKPYVRPERREALDRALKIAKIARAARLVMGELGGDLDLGL